MPHFLKKNSGFTPLEKLSASNGNPTNKGSRVRKEAVRVYSFLTGFTLIELLIYIAIIGGVSFTFIIYLSTIYQSRNKVYAAQEVQANARIAIELISQRVRLASSADASIPGRLSLAMSEPGKDPTIIDTNAGGALQIKEGAADYIPITSSKVMVTDLAFADLSGANRRKNIQIDLTLEYGPGLGNVEYAYAQNLRTAVGVRQ